MIRRIVSEQNKVFTLFLAAALAMTGVLATASVAAAAAPTAQLAPISQSQPANWAALKTSLDHDASLSRTVTVTGGLRLLTYTTASGTSFVLTEPTGQRSLAVKPNLGVVQCASWSFCVRLNRVDQGAIAAGGAIGVGIAVCAILMAAPPAGLIGCAVISAALGVAAYYIGAYGFCSNELQIELFPDPGAWPKCV